MAKSVGKGQLSAGQQLILVGLMSMLLLPMAGAKFVSGQIAKQQASYPIVFGQAKTRAILDRGDLWFRASFVDTGIVAKSMASAEPRKPATSVPEKPSTDKVTRGPPPASAAADGKPMPGVGDSPAGAKFGKHWLGGAWSLIYLSMVRLSALVSILPFLVPMVVAVLVEGEARRKLKWHAFGGADPKRFLMGARLGMWCAALAIGSLFCPGALPALTPAVLILCSALGAALWTANQQKPV